MKLASLAALALLPLPALAADVTVGQSGAPWLGYMNVFELPANGGGFVFGSPWGVSDLTATFNDPGNTLTLGPNTIGDPSEFWYIGGGGPGAAGNKIMQANLYFETTDVYSGQTVNFSGQVLSHTLTDAHDAYVFIKDFAPDYSSLNETLVPIDAAGAFNISLNTIAGAGRHVQWGFMFQGVNVWITDVAPFGTVVISTAIPTPGSLALLGIGGLFAGRRRR